VWKFGTAGVVGSILTQIWFIASLVVVVVVGVVVVVVLFCRLSSVVSYKTVAITNNPTKADPGNWVEPGPGHCLLITCRLIRGVHLHTIQ